MTWPDTDVLLLSPPLEALAAAGDVLSAGVALCAAATAAGAVGAGLRSAAPTTLVLSPPVSGGAPSSARRHDR